MCVRAGVCVWGRVGGWVAVGVGVGVSRCVWVCMCASVRESVCVGGSVRGWVVCVRAFAYVQSAGLSGFPVVR